MSSIPLDGYAIFCLPIHPLGGIHVVSSWALFQIKLLWTFTWGSLVWDLKFSFLLSKYQRIIWQHDKHMFNFIRKYKFIFPILKLFFLFFFFFIFFLPIWRNTSYILYSSHLVIRFCKYLLLTGDLFFSLVKWCILMD